uniref:Lipocalin n=1 Tax=Rhipicephalus appendiculatus TaxID=34631 RepID=A0A131Z5Y4_RHIAP
MREKHFFVAAVFATIITTAYCSCSSGCSVYNLYIQDFFNTSEPVWVYNSTATTMQGCKVDVLSGIVGKTISFQRRYIQGNRTVRESLTGLIGTDLDTIYINTGGSSCQKEKLLYFSYDHQCAVLEVTMPNSCRTPHYELRLRNSSVSAPPLYECQQKFISYHGAGHRVYANDCQRILGPGCQQAHPCYNG